MMREIELRQSMRLLERNSVLQYKDGGKRMKSEVRRLSL